MKRCASLMFSCAAAAACHPGPTRLTVPEHGGARTAIYVAVGEGRAPLVYVSDLLRAPGFPEVARVPGSTIDLYTIYYACPPELLRIPTGLAPIVEDGHPLPAGKVSYRSTIDDAGQSEWTEIQYPPISAVKIEREIKCATFDLTVVELLGTEDAFGIWSIPIGDDEVLVAVPPIGFWRASPDHIEEVPEMRNLPNYAFFRERDDRVWIYGGDNELAVGDPKTGVFDSMPGFANAPRPNRRAWMIGAPPGAPFELFTFHDRNVIARFDGTTWTKLYQGEAPSEREWAVFGGLAWLGPSDVIAVWDHYENARHVTSSTVTEETILPQNSGDLYTAAMNAPGLGPIAGTREGRTYVRGADGVWVGYPDAPIDVQVPQQFRRFVMKVSAVSPLDDGLLIGGGLGRFTQLQPRLMRNDKYCHYERDNELAVEGLVPENGFGHSIVTDIQPLGCGYVFLSKTGFSGNVEIGFLKRK